MAKSSPNRGPLIIAGAIVLVGVLVVVALAVLLGGGDSGEPQASPSASSPSPEKERKHERKSPKPPRPSESPAPSPSASPSPTPTVDPSIAIRSTILRAARQDRPGEVKHVGSVDYYRSNDECPEKQAAEANVRYKTDPKFAIWIVCKSGDGWVIKHGPVYGD